MFQGTISGGLPVEMADTPDALVELGLLYSSGRSGMVDLVAAHKWFNLAAAMGRRDAITLRQELAALMSDHDIALAQREARAWMRTH